MSFSIASANTGPGKSRRELPAAGGQAQGNEAHALTRHCVPYFQVKTGGEKGTLLAVHVLRPEFHASLVLGVPGGSFTLPGGI